MSCAINVCPSANLILCAAVLATAAVGQPQQAYPPITPPMQARTPSDIELKASYCVPVARNMVELLTKVPALPDAEGQKIAANAIADARDRLNRLQAYLAPRLSQLDSLSMLAAMKRGEADIARSDAKAAGMRDACEGTCKTGTVNLAWAQCMTECYRRDETLARIQSCNNLTWLPF